MSLYPNCTAELARRGLTQRHFEGKIGSHKTVHRKFNEPGKMSVMDMEIIAAELKLDDLNYLFEMDEKRLIERS